MVISLVHLAETNTNLLWKQSQNEDGIATENYKTHRERIHLEQKLANNKQQDGITIPRTLIKTSVGQSWIG